MWRILKYGTSTVWKYKKIIKCLTIMTLGCHFQKWYLMPAYLALSNAEVCNFIITPDIRANQTRHMWLCYLFLYLEDDSEADEHHFHLFCIWANTRIKSLVHPYYVWEVAHYILSHTHTHKTMWFSYHWSRQLLYLQKPFLSPSFAIDFI